MKTILATNCGGFIGSNLIKKLIEKSHDITSLDYYSTPNKLNEIDRFDFLAMDIEEILKIKKIYS